MLTRYVGILCECNTLTDLKPGVDCKEVIATACTTNCLFVYCNNLGLIELAIKISSIIITKDAHVTSEPHGWRGGVIRTSSYLVSGTCTGVG